MSAKTVVDVVINIGPDYLRQAAVLTRDLAKFSKIAKLHILLLDCKDDFEINLRNEIADVPFEVEFYPITNQIKNLPNIVSMRGVPIVSFGRLIISEILPLSVTSVLYVDTDIKIRKNIDELLRINFHQVIGGIRQKSVGLLNNEGAEIYDYFNAGVLVMNLEKWRLQGVGEKIIDVMNSRGPFEYMDQDVLNFVFENSWFEIDQKYNFFSENRLRFLSDKSDPVIVHFAGPFKPWLYPVASDYHHEWRVTERQYFGETSKSWFESSLGYTVLRFFKLIVPKYLIIRLRKMLQ
jgi:lipopolysaccharide biosynthesis glycosyltransferase